MRDCCPLRHTNIEFKRSKGMVQSQNLLLKAILATRQPQIIIFRDGINFGLSKSDHCLNINALVLIGL